MVLTVSNRKHFCSFQIALASIDNYMLIITQHNREQNWQYCKHNCNLRSQREICWQAKCSPKKRSAFWNDGFVANTEKNKQTKKTLKRFWCSPNYLVLGINSGFFKVKISYSYLLLFSVIRLLPGCPDWCRDLTVRQNSLEATWSCLWAEAGLQTNWTEKALSWPSRVRSVFVLYLFMVLLSWEKQFFFLLMFSD